MYRVFILCGAICLAISSAVYFRLFTRRESYGSPLDYARELSGSATLDRKLSGCVIRDITWLKFFCNILLPFMAAVALVFTALSRGETPISARVIWLCAAILTVASLLTVKLFSAASLLLLALSHVSFAVALFFPAPFLGAAIPLWLAVAVAAALCFDMVYMLRRRGLFFAAKGAEVRREISAENREGFGGSVEGLGKHQEGFGGSGEGLGKHREGFGGSGESLGKHREGFGGSGEGLGKHQEGFGERGENLTGRSKRTMGRVLGRRKRSAVVEDGGAESVAATETFSPEALAPSARLEWMLSESSGQKEGGYTDIS